MNPGDRVRVRKTGEPATFVALRELPVTWWGGRPDPPKWIAIVEYVDGDRDVVGVADIEPLIRKEVGR